MIIIGAGMAGLLAGALNPGSIIYEAGPERESDHKAIFRCRKPDIGKMVGIPFKEVTVHKAIWSDGREVAPTPRIAHMYSRKVTGTISSRSIFDTSSATRYIPPADFIHQLKKRCNIKYNNPFDDSDYNVIDFNTPVISTIPLFNMLKHFPTVDIQENFIYQPIYVNQVQIPNCNSQCTIYYPDPNLNVYRASICGNTLITEGVQPFCQKDFLKVFESMGLLIKDHHKDSIVNHKQRFGKIVPINEEKRKNAITRLTLEFGIYSLGRFATWRPKVMMDDILEDIFVIRNLIEDGHYGSLKHRQGEKS
ncbi:MAG: hypothetical protein KAS15_07105 [Nanoarchaeota archaeon]|nr:hypothetical protein [Nanoarchaeota archaeon]